MFCLLKKSQFLPFALFPDTQLRLSTLPLLFESLISISSHVSDFFVLFRFIFLACCKSRSCKERNSKDTKIKLYYSSVSLPALKIHFVVQILCTGILCTAELGFWKESLTLWSWLQSLKEIRLTGEENTLEPLPSIGQCQSSLLEAADAHAHHALLTLIGITQNSNFKLPFQFSLHSLRAFFLYACILSTKMYVTLQKQLRKKCE